MSDICQKAAESRQVNPNGAHLYLRLRESGCPGKVAINFAGRYHCRSDTTKSSDGPVGQAHFPVRTELLKDLSLEKGWAKGNISLDLGSNFQKAIIEQQPEFSNLRKLENHLNKITSKKQKTYKKNMDNLKNFFTFQSEKTLGDLKGQQLLSAVDECEQVQAMRAKIRDVASRSQDLAASQRSQQAYSSLMTKPKDAVRPQLSKKKSRQVEASPSNAEESEILLTPAELEQLEKEEEKNRKNGTIYKNSVKLLNVRAAETGARAVRDVRESVEAVPTQEARSDDSSGEACEAVRLSFETLDASEALPAPHRHDCE